MQCPVCPEERLVITDRQGIEIDYCPKCRGVWLDRGELDKIIERTADELSTIEPASGGGGRAASQAPVQQMPQTQAPPPRYDPRLDDSDYGKYRYKKRKSWLSELFD